MRHVLILALPLLLAAAACGADDDDATATTAGATTPAATDAPTTTRPLTTSPTTIGAPSTSTTVAPGGTTPVTGAGVDAAVADLAAHLGVAPAAVTVVSVEDVTWPNSAIGCPEQGMQYLQVLTEGQRIVLEVDGVPYQYNAGGSRAPFRCDKPSPAVGE